MRLLLEQVESPAECNKYFTLSALVPCPKAYRSSFAAWEIDICKIVFATGHPKLRYFTISAHLQFSVRTVKYAKSVTNDQILKEMGVIPKNKIHCSVLAEQAINTALSKYEDKNKKN